MIRNYPAVATLIRNRLNDDKSFSEKLHWFHEKGVSLKVEDEDLYTLKTEKDGHTSELISICQKGLIFRGNRFLCFMGENIPEVSLSGLNDYSGINLNEDSLLIQCVKGRTIYMFHDPKIYNWEFADEKHSQSLYKNIFLKYLYNIMMVDPAYTYFFEFLEQGENPGIYLVDMVQTKNGKRTHYGVLFDHATRLKVRAPEVYKFEGIDKIDQSDLPVYIQDSSLRKIKII